MKSRKAQIETGELIMVVMMVMVILVIGLVFYGNFKAQGMKETGRDLLSLSAVDLAQEAMSMSEISCSHARELGECVDLQRMEQLSLLMESLEPNSDFSNYYVSKFGSAMIRIEKIYPTTESWLIYDRASPNSDAQIPLRIPIYIYDGVEKTNSFGILTVVRYS